MLKFILLFPFCLLLSLLSWIGFLIFDCLIVVLYEAIRLCQKFSKTDVGGKLMRWIDYRLCASIFSV